MTTEPRAFAAEISEIFFGTESCAWTAYHPGQMTISDYQRLDKVTPWSITGIARVRTELIHDALELLGLDADGWLVRSELRPAVYMKYSEAATKERLVRLYYLPYLRLVDDTTGYALPDHTR